MARPGRKPRHGYLTDFRSGGRRPEYAAWSAAKQRCTNPNNPAWDRYGGRGITMAPEWIASFDAFIQYIGPKPGPGFSLDRIDNNGNYEIGNVRWATWHEQAHNKRPRERRRSHNSPRAGAA